MEQAPVTTSPRRRSSVPWGLLAILLVLGMLAAVFNRTPTERVRWQTDLASARARAISSGKPLFVDFTATWCPDCQELKRTAWADSAVAKELADHYVAVSVDIDKNPAVARSYDVRAIPTLMVLDPRSGKILKDDRQSPVSPNGVLQWLQS